MDQFFCLFHVGNFLVQGFQLLAVRERLIKRERVAEHKNTEIHLKLRIMF